MPGYAVATTARKPLLAAEAGAVKQTVMVTGATGFIGAAAAQHPLRPATRPHASNRAPAPHAATRAGSRLVERLLAVGHVVHVLVRPRPAGIAAADDMLAYLQVRMALREAAAAAMLITRSANERLCRTVSTATALAGRRAAADSRVRRRK